MTMSKRLISPIFLHEPKPYRMEMEELNEFRERFDHLLEDMKKRKKAERRNAEQ